MKNIIDLWKRANRKLENCMEERYAVYYNYVGNYKDDYFLSIAVVSPVSKKVLLLPNERYQVFDVDTANPNGIVEAWQTIWQLEEQENIARAYHFDYEWYGKNGDVKIFISIK